MPCAHLSWDECSAAMKVRACDLASGAPVFGNQDAIAQRSSPGLASNRANRHTVEHAAAAPAGENRASVTIRPLIPTPAQRVRHICAETDVLAADADPSHVVAYINRDSASKIPVVGSKASVLAAAAAAWMRSRKTKSADRRCPSRCPEVVGGSKISESAVGLLIQVKMTISSFRNSLWRPVLEWRLLWQSRAACMST
jgi:hypothetical protein